MTDGSYNVTELYLGRPNAKRPIIGKNVVIPSPVPCIFDCQDQITIGDNSFIGHGVKILTGYHDMKKLGQERQWAILTKPVTIGKGVWIASYVIILPGVTIGDNAVIGAGSVVTRDVPANEFWAGNPAIPIRRIDEL